MDPAALKARWGHDLVFWGGGVDTQHTLPFGTPDEVEAQVRRNAEVFGAGGGFVFCTVHNVQARVPTENLLAMFRALGTLE
jgi:uroporphyrinogen-III decarboxylase